MGRGRVGHRRGRLSGRAGPAWSPTAGRGPAHAYAHIHDPKRASRGVGERPTAAAAARQRRHPQSSAHRFHARASGPATGGGALVDEAHNPCRVGRGDGGPVGGQIGVGGCARHARMAGCAPAPVPPAAPSGRRQPPPHMGEPGMEGATPALGRPPDAVCRRGLAGSRARGGRPAEEAPLARVGRAGRGSGQQQGGTATPATASLSRRPPEARPAMASPAPDGDDDAWMELALVEVGGGGGRRGGALRAPPLTTPPTPVSAGLLRPGPAGGTHRVRPGGHGDRVRARGGLQPHERDARRE